MTSYCSGVAETANTQDEFHMCLQNDTLLVHLEIDQSFSETEITQNSHCV